MKRIYNLLWKKSRVRNKLLKKKEKFRTIQNKNFFRLYKERFYNAVYKKVASLSVYIFTGR